MVDKQPKNCLLLLSSIEKIMLSSPDVSDVSSDSVFLIAKAAEEFVAYLARQALRSSDNKKLLTYKDLSKVVCEIDNLEFLKNIFPSEPELPLKSIKKIMKCSPDVSSVSEEATFLIAKAAEGLVAFLAREALEASDNKKIVDYKDLAKVVGENESLEFLWDTVPPKIKGEKYMEILKKIEEQEKERALEDQEL